MHGAVIECGSGFQPRFIRLDKHLLIVSCEHRRWPQEASLIRKETFGIRFRNRPLLGFAFRDSTGQM
ncbi:hypothetical protein JY97_16055 [Alkalispirochaeta odontotermitis]|nr:hypothetical protein JY97_16055 [Alkalispirochaeta odontotermitis]